MTTSLSTPRQWRPSLASAVKALKNDMSNGLVLSMAEAGMDEDAGRTRVTVRSRARAWGVVMKPDGNLIADPVPILDPQPAANVIRLLDLVRGAP